MRKLFFVFYLFIFSFTIRAQEKLTTLTVEKIMRDPKWIGTSPSSPYWSYDSKELFFNWNPDKELSDSLYSITLGNKIPRKITTGQRQKILSANNINYNLPRTAYVYSKDGDIYCTEIKSGKTLRVTHTTDIERDPQFSFNESSVVYTKDRKSFFPGI
ncbi:MAG: hypothetical protein WDO19_28395 [Bacteroidota bacterium]